MNAMDEVAMTSVADLVEPEALARLATPANVRLGKQIVDQAGVEFTQFGPLRVRAKVGGVPPAAQRRSVELSSGSNGLEWSCACTKRKELFCKHCVAAAVLTWRNAPARR